MIFKHDDIIYNINVETAGGFVSDEIKLDLAVHVYADVAAYYLIDVLTLILIIQKMLSLVVNVQQLLAMMLGPVEIF